MITNFKIFEGNSKFPKEIMNFLDGFPNDATLWSEATDEIRDLARFSREIYNEITLNSSKNDDNILEPLNFRSFKTPAQWNTEAKKFIISTYSKMNDESKKYFIEKFNKIFKIK
jgi:hypothetical protein